MLNTRPIVPRDCCWGIIPLIPIPFSKPPLVAGATPAPAANGCDIGGLVCPKIPGVPKSPLVGGAAVVGLYTEPQAGVVDETGFKAEPAKPPIRGAWEVLANKEVLGAWDIPPWGSPKREGCWGAALDTKIPDWG